MKQSLLSIFILSLVGLFLGCDKQEITPRDYPRVTTLPVTEITSNGARFNAEIIFRGDFEIVNFGFVWSEFRNPVRDNSDQWIFFKNLEGNNFSRLVETSLKKDITYYVRAFVETKDFVVYGGDEVFVSQGSNVPLLKGFLPESGMIKDTIAIQGNGFSFVKDQNIIRFGNIKAKVLTASDTLLQVVVPFELNQEKTTISIEIAGFTTSFFDEFILLQPTILDFSKEELEFCDSVKFTLANFPTNSLEVYFKEELIPFIRTEQNEIIAIPPSILSNRGIIYPVIEVANFSITSEKPLTLLTPEIELVHDSSFLNLHDTLTIRYEHLDNCDIEVLVGNQMVGPIASSENEISVRIPVDLSFSHDIPIRILVGEELIHRAFIPRKLVVDNLTPASAKAGDLVRINGRGFHPIDRRNVIQLEPRRGCIGVSSCQRIEPEILEVSSRHIVFKIPDNIKNYVDENGNIDLRLSIWPFGVKNIVYKIDL